eukprot:scaffold6443_cov79-Phaeocystis_antarctica.AAC.2
MWPSPELRLTLVPTSLGKHCQAIATNAKLLHSVSSAAMIGSPCSSNARSCARWYAQPVTNAARCPACD